MNQSLSDPRHFRRHALILLVAGLLVQGWLVTRQGILPDQNAVLYSGTQFLASDDLPAFAKPSSAGAQLPGFLLPALVAGAITVWHDYRSPTLFAVIPQVCAFLLLALVLTRTLETRWAVVYLSLYWLSAWRLFHSASAWEPAFVFLPAALHMLLCYRQRDRRHFLESTLLALVLAVSFQIHASSFILLVSFVWLWVTRRVKVHWAGLLTGIVVACLFYLPTIQWVLSSPTDTGLPQTHQGVLAGMLSLLKGTTFWLRMSTPDLGERLSQAGGFYGGDQLFMALRVLLGLLVLPSALFTWRMIRTPDHASPGSSWLRLYSLACLGSTLVASLVSPASVQTWHVVIVLHAALIPLVLFLRHRGEAGQRGGGAIVVACLILNLGTTCVLGFCHEQYTPPTAASLDALNAPQEVRALVGVHP